MPFMSCPRNQYFFLHTVFIIAIVHAHIVISNNFLMWLSLFFWTISISNLKFKLSVLH